MAIDLNGQVLSSILSFNIVIHLELSFQLVSFCSKDPHILIGWPFLWPVTKGGN